MCVCVRVKETNRNMKYDRESCEVVHKTAETWFDGTCGCFFAFLRCNWPSWLELILLGPYYIAQSKHSLVNDGL